MRSRATFTALVAFAAAAALAGSAAHADQIDGSWCSPAGESITVEGQSITTPGGARIVGYYDRHHVAFTIPEGEGRAGDLFEASQIDDDRISVTLTAKPAGTRGQPEVWTKCEVVS